MKKISVILIAVSVSILVFLLVYDAFQTKSVTDDFFAMNTYVSVEAEGKNAYDDVKEIRKTVERLDKKVLSRTSENSLIYSLNKNGEINPDGVFSAQLALLSDISLQSGGAFDFTLGAVSDLWNFGGTPCVPDENELSQALSHSGYEKITITAGSVKKTDSEAVVDLGASGKGIALDYISDYLEGSSCERAVVSVGGSVLLYGEDDFTVGIRNPGGDSAGYIAKLNMTAGCISTSGTYEQSFEENGKTYHHILNPENGFPVENGLLSVTVISESGLLSDALSTACFVLGIERGTALAESYGAKVIFIDEDKKIYTDSSTQKLIELTDTGYSFAEE